MPASPPASEQQASTEATKLGAPNGSKVSVLSNAVATDDLSLGIDYAGNGPTEADLARWKSDAEALRAYCA
ncbi:MAG TPA: hypothetical protein VH478_04080 [Trebonia sp.]|nr:hypothetical protein [Trebonia sp.]